MQEFPVAEPGVFYNRVVLAGGVLSAQLRGEYSQVRGDRINLEFLSTVFRAGPLEGNKVSAPDVWKGLAQDEGARHPLVRV